MAQPGQTVKGKPPLAGLRPLDGQLPAAPGDGRRRGIYTTGAFVGTNFALFLWAQAPKIHTLRCASSPHEVCDFMGHPVLGDEKTSGHDGQRCLLLLIRFFLVGLGKLGRLLLFPVGQQGHDLILHLAGRGLLAEELFQFRAGNNHVTILLFLFFTQNAINDIRGQLVVLIQLPEPVCLSLGGRGLLALNGNGDILLVGGTDAGDFHGGFNSGTRSLSQIYR